LHGINNKEDIGGVKIISKFNNAKNQSIFPSAILYIFLYKKNILLAR